MKMESDSLCSTSSPPLIYEGHFALEGTQHIYVNN